MVEHLEVHKLIKGTQHGLVITNLVSPFLVSCIVV